MTDRAHRRKLDVRLDRKGIERILQTGQRYDIEKGGLYDARSGCVNIWAAPEDKPGCWDTEIEAAGLDYPRSYVGSLDWEWGEADIAELFVEAAPYDLLDKYERKGFPAEDWEEVLRWTEAKARELLVLAETAPEVIGTHCPFCSFVLPSGALINTLLAHITEKHPHEKPTALVIGNGVEVVTRNDTYPLLPAEKERASEG